MVYSSIYIYVNMNPSIGKERKKQFMKKKKTPTHGKISQGRGSEKPRPVRGKGAGCKQKVPEFVSAALIVAEFFYGFIIFQGFLSFASFRSGGGGGSIFSGYDRTLHRSGK